MASRTGRAQEVGEREERLVGESMMGSSMTRNPQQSVNGLALLARGGNIFLPEGNTPYDQ